MAKRRKKTMKKIKKTANRKTTWKKTLHLNLDLTADKTRTLNLIDRIITAAQNKTAVVLD
jgi:hypothetical protein